MAFQGAFMFYENFKSLCDNNGTTVTAVLKKLNISTSKGTAWKNGSVPNGEVLSRLASYFNVSTDYLLGKDTKDVRNPATEDDIKFALFNGADGITDEMYEEVKAFAAFVKQREQQKGKK